MKARWIGVTGAVLVLTALVLGTLGPRLLPTAFWSNAPVSLNGSGMMGNGMLGPGMMSGGMMSGMMGSAVAGDPRSSARSTRCAGGALTGTAPPALAQCPA